MTRKIVQHINNKFSKFQCCNKVLFEKEKYVPVEIISVGIVVKGKAVIQYDIEESVLLHIAPLEKVRSVCDVS